MNKQEFEEQLKDIFHVTNEQLEQFETYKKYLQEQNKIHNLTRLDGEDVIYADYFFNSIYPYKDLDFEHINKVLDVGSGSGIPGIALKILFPHIELTIVESVNKKIKFMQGLCELLKFEHVYFINKRAEELEHKYKNYFDLVTARAVANLRILLELLIPYMKMTGICVIPKGIKVNEEMQDAKQIIRKLKIELFEEIKYESISKHKEFVLLFKKNAETPSIYPRKWKSIINEEEN